MKGRGEGEEGVNGREGRGMSGGERGKDGGTNVTHNRTVTNEDSILL